MEVEEEVLVPSAGGVEGCCCCSTALLLLLLPQLQPLSVSLPLSLSLLLLLLLLLHRYCVLRERLGARPMRMRVRKTLDDEGWSMSHEVRHVDDELLHRMPRSRHEPITQQAHAPTGCTQAPFCTHFTPLRPYSRMGLLHDRRSAAGLTATRW